MTNMDPRTAFGDFCKALERAEMPGANLPDSLANCLPEFRKVATVMSRYFAKSVDLGQKEKDLSATLEIMSEIQDRDLPSSALMQTMGMLCIALARSAHLSTMRESDAREDDPRIWEYSTMLIVIQSISRDMSKMLELLERNQSDIKQVVDLLRDVRLARQSWVHIERILNLSGNSIASNNTIIIKSLFGKGSVGDELCGEFFQQLRRIKGALVSSVASGVSRGMSGLVENILENSKELGRRLGQTCSNVLRRMEILDSGEVVNGLDELSPQGYLEARSQATEFALKHDDGEGLDRMRDAHITIVGLPLSGKTSLCLMLANEGVRAANVPIAPNIHLPSELDKGLRCPTIGLMVSSDDLLDRRIKVRGTERTRQKGSVNLEEIQVEIAYTSRVFREHHWPIVSSRGRTLSELVEIVIEMSSLSAD